MKRFTLSFFVLLCLSLGAVALSSCAPAANIPAARTTETAVEKPIYTVKFVIIHIGQRNIVALKERQSVIIILKV